MKRLLIISFIVAILFPKMVIAKSEKVRLTIINQTGEDIYIRIDQYTMLTAKYIEPDFLNDKPTTVIDMGRDRYQGVEIYACGAISTGDLDLTRNLKLNFTPCEEMYKTDSRKYPGEPSMEKYNWRMAPGKVNQRFSYYDVNILDYDINVLDASGTAGYLKDIGDSAVNVAIRLRDGFRLEPQEIAQILKNIGFSPVEVGTALYSVFAFSAKDAGQLMKLAGYNASSVYKVLKSVFGLNLEGARVILIELLFSSEEILEAVIEELAIKFAPQLRFDDWNYLLSLTIHYPMSAKDYYEKVVAGTLKGLSNTDPKTVSENNVPTYWKASMCGNQIRILYWWFYGKQDCCDDVQGAHKGDWERIMVILSEDTTRIAAVTFYQHSGWYTRLGERDGFKLTEDTHPVVYVGRQAHGSYHYKAYDQSCCYWADHRNGEGPHLSSWENLIRLQSVSEGGEAWMDADLAGGFKWGGISTHPMQKDISCNQKTCTGTPTWGCHLTGCWKSQCKVGDRDDGITCWHCASGYTNCGLACAKGGAGNCILPWKLHDISTYGLRYKIPTTDKGLLYKDPRW